MSNIFSLYALKHLKVSTFQPHPCEPPHPNHEVNLICPKILSQQLQQRNLACVLVQNSTIHDIYEYIENWTEYILNCQLGNFNLFAQMIVATKRPKTEINYE